MSCLFIQQELTYFSLVQSGGPTDGHDHSLSKSGSTAKKDKLVKMKFNYDVIQMLFSSMTNQNVEKRVHIHHSVFNNFSIPWNSHLKRNITSLRWQAALQ